MTQLTYVSIMGRQVDVKGEEITQNHSHFFNGGNQQTITLPVRYPSTFKRKKEKRGKKRRKKNGKKTEEKTKKTNIQASPLNLKWMNQQWLSRFGKKQLCHLGYTFCVNKAPKNNRTYLRCAYGKGPTQCKASVCVVGTLEDGKFQLHVLYHHQDRHSHEPSPIEKAVKQFWERFQKEAQEKIDTPVPICVLTA